MDLWQAHSHLLIDQWQEEDFIFLEVSITYFHSYKGTILGAVMAGGAGRDLSAEHGVSVSEGMS